VRAGRSPGTSDVDVLLSRAVTGAAVATLLALSSQPGQAQADQPLASGNQTTFPRFGGPDSVQDQLDDDARSKDSLTGKNLLQGYDDWKARLRSERGLSFTLDYTAGMLAATNTIGSEDTFASGAVRFYGSWDLVGRDTGNTGSFIWKVENRHRYTDVPVSGTASNIGYAGAILSPLSDAGSRLTNFYWKQLLNQGRVEIIAGMIDTTDWVDLYALASPWTGFFNFAFATGGATIALPDDAALGAYVNAMLTDNIYVIGGFADANAISTDPLNGFDTAFNDHEFFKTVEIGWTGSQDRFYTDNTHLTYWNADDREAAGVPSGWGLNFSWSRSLDDKWLPFLRAGYANDSGSILQKSLSTAFGYHLKDDVSLVGVGLNWGEPNTEVYGSGLRARIVF
jgi:porin